MAHLCLFRSNAMHSISTAKIQNPVGYICDYKMYMYTYVVCASVFFFRSLLLVIRKWKYHRKPVVTTKYDFHWRTRFFFLRHISFWTSTKKIYCAYDIMYVIFMISYALRFLHLLYFIFFCIYCSRAQESSDPFSYPYQWVRGGLLDAHTIHEMHMYIIYRHSTAYAWILNIYKAMFVENSRKEW